MANRPEIPEHLAEVWTDFIRLSRSRGYAGSHAAPLPIPFDVMDRYAQRFGPHGVDEFERWLTLINAMDDAWRESTANRPS